jgi:hypothetical protein
VVSGDCASHTDVFGHTWTAENWHEHESIKDRVRWTTFEEEPEVVKGETVNKKKNVQSMWDVRHWDTKGIIKVEGRPGPLPVADSGVLQKFYPEYEIGNPGVLIDYDVFTYKADAIDKVNELRQLRMKELRQEYKRLERLMF